MAKVEGSFQFTKPPHVQIARILQTPEPLPDDQKGINNTYYGSLTLENGLEQPAYIKHIPADEIFTETICSLICCAMGIPTPTPYLAILDGDAKLPGVNTSDDNPLLFATADAKRPTFKSHPQSEQVWQLLIRWAHTPNSAVFDEQIGNIDRNAGNILMDASGGCCLIDHGFAFHMSVTPSMIQPDNPFAKILPFHAEQLRPKKQPLDIIAKALPNLTGVRFDDLLTFSRGELYASPEHIERIRLFYETRLNHIRDIFDLRFGTSANQSLPL